MTRDAWDFGDVFGAGFGPRFWAFCYPGGRRGPGRARRRQQMFESGEVKYVILRLLKEKPRHGYEIIKALEEKMGGWYSPSAGTVYPTLQLLEDQGYVRVVEQEGKKVYHITPEGEQFLEEHRDVIDDIFDRVRDAIHSLGHGSMAELNQAFARVATLAYRHAWRAGPEDEYTKRIVEILRRAAEEIEKARPSAA
ncbi:MAG: PadR family transcriptional regulator [Gemmatimonadetes bacterium]|nr:PadR family transcriptional regulator [Gemmatimonadota bacterium]